MDILSVCLKNSKLDYANFDEVDPETIIHVRLTAWCNRFKQLKILKKDISKELMPVAQRPTNGGIGACQKIRKNE